jgi:hypothetical protein
MDSTTNVKLRIQFLETLEELRDLSLPEWNFRVIPNDKLTKLLKHHKTYWRQRGSIKWTKFGDTNTKFFHANATIKYRKNLISHLISDDNIPTTSHKDKESLLWQAFKDRLGTSEFSGFYIHPEDFINKADFLADFEDDFTKAKIDGINKSLPNDKSPDQYGFSNEFLKKCWPIIRQDFYKLCKDFQQSTSLSQKYQQVLYHLDPKN